MYSNIELKEIAHFSFLTTLKETQNVRQIKNKFSEIDNFDIFQCRPFYQVLPP